MLRSSLYAKARILEILQFFCDTSWEGGGTLPKNIYKATLLRRTRSVASVSEILRYKHTDKQTIILLLYYKDEILR